MNGACESHCCSAFWSLVEAWSTFKELALPPFLLSFSDLSCAPSNSLAMAARFPPIVDICWYSRLVVLKFRNGSSTSFSIRWISVKWELEISSVDARIFFHGESNTLGGTLASLLEREPGAIGASYPSSPPTSCSGLRTSFLSPATYASSTLRRSCLGVNFLP